MRCGLPAACTALRGTMHILVADDTPAEREALAAILRQAGCDVVVAGDGEQALRLALEQRFQAIFTECDMPRTSGEEFLRNYRAIGGEAPVILITAERDRDRLARLIELGIQGFVPKPFTAAAVTLALANLPLADGAVR